MNNFDEIIKSIISNKENNNCPILALGYLHSLEWKSCFEDNGIDLKQLIEKINHDLILPKIRLDFEMQDSILNYNNIINKKLTSFHNEANTNRNIKSPKVQLYSKSKYPIKGNITNKSICFHSVGDPFIQGWVFSEKLHPNIAWVSDNLSTKYEDNLLNISFGERKFLLENIIDIDINENLFLFFLPSFCLENYNEFKKLLSNDISNWPNFAIHIGASTCFTDPVFHLLGIYKNIRNIGVQHGGGPITIFLDYKTELKAYNEFYFLPPFSKTLHNTRGDNSFQTIFYINSIKLILFVFCESYRKFGFYDYFIRSLYRIIYNFYKTTNNYFKSFYKIKPIIIFDRFYDNHNFDFIKNSKNKYYIKLHPFDNYKDYELLVDLEKNKIIEIFPIKKKIEFNLWRWRRSFIIINSYRSTVLIFLFEGIVPFLIVLTLDEISNIKNTLSSEALETFKFLLKNDVIVASNKFESLSYIELKILANNSKNICKKNFSTSNKLLKRIFSKINI